MWPKFHKADSACHSWKGLTREELRPREEGACLEGYRISKGQSWSTQGFHLGSSELLSSRGLLARHG